MSKILSIEEMISAAETCGMPNTDAIVRTIEAAADCLAQGLANHLKIDTAGASNDIGGIMASFHPKTKRQKCPDVIDEGDPNGDWRDE